VDWEFAFVLPNLVLPSDEEDLNPGAFPNGFSLAADFLTVLPGDHDTVQRLRAENPTVDQILGSFYNEYGVPYSPAVLVVRKTASEELRRSLEAFVAFRNALALSVILRARAGLMADRGAASVTWSDTFDFHPAQVGGTNRMVLQSPALTSLVASNAKLRLTHSPYVQLEGRRLWPDHYLLRSLGRAWTRRFTPQPRTDTYGDRLFRSLEAAYQACGVGGKNEASIHEYGTQIALWVSACEILAWPERRHADLHAVLALIDRYDWRPETQKRRFTYTYRKARLRLSAPQRAYTYLYRARNDFLHGNPVSFSTMLTRRASERVGLPRIAAAVYRTALVGYLSKRYPTNLSLKTLNGRAMEMFDHDIFDDAFAEAFSYTL
jgi:hypothetical protein